VKAVVEIVSTLQKNAPAEQDHGAADHAQHNGLLSVSIAVVSHPQRVILATGSCIYVAEV
jgi:hypothetical protein